jgi:hypothetical protein
LESALKSERVIAGGARRRLDGMAHDFGTGC